ncbi:hypothetical protein N7492_001468 [Penicillium capsulatum]|uniref:G domain-containing protein n=1 Tax=Penicillium capsulatum TaxID=69766 RepID=A0A9W9ITV4_9EURO|nr:hypothetical protein N7492_001468 [Penicillium capsulatum]
MDTNAEQLVDQAERFAVFTGITKPNPENRFFLVMGETGSGESTFISRCTGKDVAVSDSLHSRKTTFVSASKEEESDTCTRYGVDRHLRLRMEGSTGLPHRHARLQRYEPLRQRDAGDPRLVSRRIVRERRADARGHHPTFNHGQPHRAGSDIRNIQIIKAMCNFSSYANLLIATTMWPPDLSINDRAFLLNQQTHLKITGRYFGWFVVRGATMARHNENDHRDEWEERNSARNIVNHLIEQAEKSPPEPLLLQRELIDEGKNLLDTTAGFAINAKLYKARKDHEGQLKEIEAEIKKEPAQEDAEHASQLRELKEEVEWGLEEAIQDKKALEKSMQEMHEKKEKFWKERISSMEKQFHGRLELKQQELVEMKESLAEIRKDMSRRGEFERNDQELRRHEDTLGEFRDELVQAHQLYQRFTGKSTQDEEMRKGTLNGVASGVMSGLITSAATAATAAGMCTVM